MLWWLRRRLPPVALAAVLRHVVRILPRSFHVGGLMSRLVLCLLLKLGAIILLRMHQLAFIVVPMMPLAHHPASLMLQRAWSAANLWRLRPH